MVTAFADAPGAAEILSSSPDLSVLDVMLPSSDGFELARTIRARRDIPIVSLTARDTVADRVAVFALGADDYLVKPFALEELLARVRAVLRGSGHRTAPIESGEVLLDEASATATRANTPIELTPTELRLIAFPMRHRGAALSKDQLLTQVWGYDFYDAYDENLVEVHISTLRRKLEAHGSRVIDTVRGLGLATGSPREDPSTAHAGGARHASGPRARPLGLAITATVAYRDALMGDLRAHLVSGAAALDAAAPDQLKPLVSSLILEGIDTHIAVAGSPSKPRAPTHAAPRKPPAVQNDGSLLVLHDLLTRDRPVLVGHADRGTANVGTSVDRLITVELIAAS